MLLHIYIYTVYVHSICRFQNTTRFTIKVLILFLYIYIYLYIYARWSIYSIMYTMNRKLEDNATKCVRPAIYRPTHATVSVICVMTNKWTRWRSLVAVVTSLTQRLRHSAKRKLPADGYRHWPVLTTTCGATLRRRQCRENFTAVGAERCDLQRDNRHRRGGMQTWVCANGTDTGTNITHRLQLLCVLDSVASNRHTDIYIYIHICIHLFISGLGLVGHLKLMHIQ